MTWINAFDAGSCTVSVQNAVGDNLFSGVLAKGQTSAPFAGQLADELLQVSVDSVGLVVVEWLSGNGPAQGYVLVVTPAYDVSTASLRMRSVLMPNGVGGPGQAQAWSSATTADPPVELDTAGDDVWTPDPVVLTDTPHDSWNLYMGGGV